MNNENSSPSAKNELNPQLSVDSPVPHICLVGFCDRSVDLTKGHPAFWHKNIVGLSFTKVFHVYPLNLRGHRIVLSIYELRIGKEIVLHFRPTTTKNPFDLKISISGAKERIVDEATISSKKLERNIYLC